MIGDVDQPAGKSLEDAQSPIQVIVHGDKEYIPLDVELLNKIVAYLAGRPISEVNDLYNETLQVSTEMYQRHLGDID